MPLYLPWLCSWVQLFWKCSRWLGNMQFLYDSDNATHRTSTEYESDDSHVSARILGSEAIRLPVMESSLNLWHLRGNLSYYLVILIPWNTLVVPWTNSCTSWTMVYPDLDPIGFKASTCRISSIHIVFLEDTHQSRKIPGAFLKSRWNRPMCDRFPWPHHRNSPETRVDGLIVDPIANLQGLEGEIGSMFPESQSTTAKLWPISPCLSWFMKEQSWTIPEIIQEIWFWIVNGPHATWTIWSLCFDQPNGLDCRRERGREKGDRGRYMSIYVGIS